ncbi:MAG: hypothetical protein F4W95_13410 [Chloroflexi bacterium]|nr:hypothetical protein [Chloroflexota bacterium]MYD49463.1 hypothetical protein [Chloroflexota bacterium]
MSDRRAYHLAQFYELLDRLEDELCGARRLSECDGKMGWPRRGVYFFRESGENRSDSGDGPRVVRVGTHALKAGGKATLWNRLSQHRGTVKSGGGNHGGSIFRSITGAALMQRDGWDCSTWGHGSNAPKAVREAEHPLEQAVSAVIRDMPFLWLAMDDEPGPGSQRGYIERNAIALLSNYKGERIDQPSGGWLGYHSEREKVRKSGLWNNNHVEGGYDPAFLDCLERLIG